MDLRAWNCFHDFQCVRYLGDSGKRRRRGWSAGAPVRLKPDSPFPQRWLSFGAIRYRFFRTTPPAGGAFLRRGAGGIRAGSEYFVFQPLLWGGIHAAPRLSAGICPETAPLPYSSLVFSTARNALWGSSTSPTIFIRFLPSFCFSRSFRLRVMSPP